MAYNDLDEDSEKPERTEIKFDSILNILSKEMEHDKKIYELLSKLNKHKTLLEDSKRRKATLNNQQYRITLHSILESMLVEIGYITNKQLKQQTINKLYSWYNSTYEHYSKIIQMREKTYLDSDIILTPEEISISNNEKNEDSGTEHSVSEDGCAHREKYGPNGFLARGLKFYEKKEIVNPFKKKISIIKNEDLNEQQLKERENFLTTLKSTFYQTNKCVNNAYAATTNKHFFNAKLKQENETKKKEELFKCISSKNKDTVNKEDIQLYDENVLLLKVKKEILSQQNINIANKRKEDELFLTLNEFGKSKAAFKSVMNNKYELKELVKYYKDNMESDSVRYKLKEDSVKQIINNVEMAMDNDYEIKQKQLRKMSTVVDIKKYNIKKETSSLNKKISLSKIDDIRNIYNKVNTAFPKNLSKNNCIIPSDKEERVITIKFNIDKNKIRNMNSNTEVDPEKVPFTTKVDNIYKNKIFLERTKSEKMLNVNPFIKKINTGYFKHFNPLSKYNPKYKGSFLSYSDNKYINTKYKEKNISSILYAKKNFINNDYLKLRKTMSTFKLNDLNNLTSSFDYNKINLIYGKNSKLHNKSKSYSNLENILQNKALNDSEEYMYNSIDANRYIDNKNISKFALDSAFLIPNIRHSSDQSYLPKAGFGLLNLPVYSFEVDIKKGKKK